MIHNKLLRFLVGLFLLFLFMHPLAYADTAAGLRVDSAQGSLSANDDKAHPILEVSKNDTITITVTDLPGYINQSDRTHEYRYEVVIGDQKHGKDNDYGKMYIYLLNGTCTKMENIGGETDHQFADIWNMDSNVTKCDPAENDRVKFHTQFSMVTLLGHLGDHRPSDNIFAVRVKSSPGGKEKYWATIFLKLTDTPKTPVTITTNATPGGLNGANYQLAHDTPIRITMNGCTANTDGNPSTVDFSWRVDIAKYDTQAPTSTRDDFFAGVPILFTSIPFPPYIYSNATFQKGGCDQETGKCDPQTFTYDDDQKSLIGGNQFIITGVCSSDGRKASTKVNIVKLGQGNEIISITPSEPIIDEAFNAEVQYLEDATCYYIRIRDNNRDENDPNKFVTVPIHREDANDTAIDTCADLIKKQTGSGTSTDTNLTNQETNILAASDTWGGITDRTIEMPPLYLGSFTIRLYKTTNVSETPEDGEVATHDFVVKLNAGAPKNLPCSRGGISTEGKCIVFPSVFGNIQTEPGNFIGRVFSVILGLAGGIALILIIRSGYVLATSSGNPERVEEAKEILTAAIVGLLFIIFAFVILQTITVDLFKLPGFTK